MGNARILGASRCQCAICRASNWLQEAAGGLTATVEANSVRLFGQRRHGNAAQNGNVHAGRRAVMDGRLMAARFLLPCIRTRGSRGKGDRAHTVPHEDRRPCSRSGGRNSPLFYALRLPSATRARARVSRRLTRRGQQASAPSRPHGSRGLGSAGRGIATVRLRARSSAQGHSPRRVVGRANANPETEDDGAGEALRLPAAAANQRPSQRPGKPRPRLRF